MTLKQRFWRLVFGGEPKCVIFGHRWKTLRSGVRYCKRCHDID